MAKVRKAPAFWLEGGSTKYAIYIDRPKVSDADNRSSQPWIVMVCMDGDDQFTELCKARTALAKARPLPPLLLVGVGYGASYANPKNKRVRDYTAGPDPEVDGKEMGGAAGFLEFLKEVLWPELTRRYPVDTRVRGISGHSLGGLLALHALFCRRPFFNRALVLAPSIWWGGRAVLGTVAERQERRGRLPAWLFVGIGLKDGRSMIGDVGLLEMQLAARPVRGLETSFARLPGFTHHSVTPAGFRTGLAALFGERPKSPRAG